MITVLKIQASTEVRAGKPTLKSEAKNLVADISGVIGITSDSFSGSVVIAFPQKTFLAVMSRMIGEECTSLNKEIIDGVGELTNIIFGQAKITLNEKGYGIKTAIPSVISGQGHTVQNFGEGPVVMIPFNTDVGDFYVEICVS